VSVVRLVAACLAVVLAASSCSSPQPGPGSVRIVGSDTMLVLMRRLAVGFMTARPGTTVVVDGGGTGVGVEALIGGTADLCAASRPLAADEVQRLFDLHGTIGARVVVAQDALSVWVHPANPVRKLSLSALSDLFAGQVGRWDAVGGEPRPVVPVIRPPNSGTARFFRDHVLLGRPYAEGAVAVPTTSAVVATVASDPGAIGYGGIAYGDDRVTAVAIGGAPPTLEAVRAGGYPLVRFLQLYSVAPPHGAAREFVDYCLSPAGQHVVSEVGYIPGWER
jgi:phosphate transport system substrate-binding protein